MKKYAACIALALAIGACAPHSEFEVLTRPLTPTPAPKLEWCRLSVDPLTGEVSAVECKPGPRVP